uniref:Uncharacterized protein n=1 Tax=viral metagenome TaxID=1070528 RepID=A0A6M3K8T7_9ZZZZ
MSAIAVPLMIAGTGMSIIGQIQQGQAMSQAAKYNAQVAQAQAGAIQSAGAFEATVLEQTSAFEREALTKESAFEREALEKQSAVDRAKILREKTAMTSEQRTMYAKSGVRVGVGTPLEVMADTAAQYELDLAANRYNLALSKERISYEEAAGKERLRYGEDVGKERIRYETATGVSRSKSESAYQNLLAKQYKSASYWGAGSTLLTSAGIIGAMGGGGGTTKTYTGPMGQGKVIRFRGI